MAVALSMQIPEDFAPKALILSRVEDEEPEDDLDLRWLEDRLTWAARLSDAVGAPEPFATPFLRGRRVKIAFLFTMFTVLRIVSLTRGASFASDGSGCNILAVGGREYKEVQSCGKFRYMCNGVAFTRYGF